LVHIAITRFRCVPRTGGVMWRPVLGALLGYVNIVLIGFLALALWGKGQHNLDMYVCLTNLRQIQNVLQAYAEHHKAAYPPLCSRLGVLMFSPDAIPENDQIGSLLTCPTMRHATSPTTGPASPFDDQSYFYLGYAVLNDDDVEAFAQAYRKKMAEDGNFDEDLVVENGKKIRVLHRLRADVERLLCAEAGVTPLVMDTTPVTAKVMGKIPILIERDFGHINVDDAELPLRVPGAHVLYLSGDVGFVERGKWPITEKTQRILAELAK